MTFNPLDPTTWHDDPEDFAVPPHEAAAATAQAELIYTCDAHEEEQVRAFLGLDRWDMTEEDKQQCMRQVMEGRKAIQDALERLTDAEKALDGLDERANQDSEDAMNMTDEDVAEEMQRRAGWDQEEI